MTTPVPVKLSKIYLDLNNPRHETLDNEAAVIQRLISKEDVKVLARHIAETGSISPLDMLALAPHPRVPNAYVAAEGNRRVCALKLLSDPDKAGFESDKAYFRKLKVQLSAPIQEVLAVIFPDMDSARVWVELRHDAPAGVGTKKWEADERTRFNREGKDDSPNALALAVVEHAKARQLIPEDDIEKLVITTVTRFLGTPDVRSALGITDNRKLLIDVPTAEFDRGLTKFFRDALEEKSPVNSRTNAAERKAYAETIRARGFSPVTRGLPPQAPDASAIAFPAKQGSVKTTKTGAAGQRNPRDRDKDKFVVPTGFVAKVNDPVFKRLYRELRTLEAEYFSFSATYLLRALIEQAALLFLKKHNVQPIPRDLHLKLGKVAEALTAQGYAGKGMQGLRKMASVADSLYSPDTIGSFIHGSQIPTRVYVIKAWDSFEPIMAEIVRQVGTK